MVVVVVVVRNFLGTNSVEIRQSRVNPPIGYELFFPLSSFLMFQ